MQILCVDSPSLTLANSQSSIFLRSRMPPNVPVPKLLQFHRIAFPLRSSTCTHAPLAMPPSPLSRVFANMDKEDRLSPTRRAASQWSTLLNSSDLHTAVFVKWCGKCRHSSSSAISFYVSFPRSTTRPLPTRPSFWPSHPVRIHT